MATYFTSDLHLGHARIIDLCARPFGSVQAMDAALIEHWNAVVRPGDDVWVLGDFCWRSSKTSQGYLERLSGNKHLVWGNHDAEQTRKARGWVSSQAYAEVVVDGRKVCLFHYGQRVWNGMRRHAVHLFGHSHGSLPGFSLVGGDGGCLDVGVDCWGYAPTTMDAIQRRIRSLEPLAAADHHYGAVEDE